MTKTYYGDLFKVNGKGVVVFGHGKTRVMRAVVGEETDDNRLIINDCICFDIKDGNLIAMPDFYGIKQLPEEACKVDVMLYHEGEDENGDYGKIDEETFINKAEFNINFQADVDRKDEMRDLLKGQNISFYDIPWCETEEERKKMIIKALK